MMPLGRLLYVLLTLYLVLGIAVFAVILGATIVQTLYGPANP